MKQRSIILVLILATLVVAQSVGPLAIARPRQAAQNAQAISAAKIEKIEAAISAWMAQHKAPALSVAIVVENRLAWSNGFGLADVENSVPAKATTAYRLASITKSITATAIMQLVEKGKIDLDAPVQKYCPAFPEKQWPVTTRQLLIHWGGVRHNKPVETISTRHFNSTEDALSVFKDDPLLHEPGTKYFYSTLGYVVLGCVIEGVSGMKYKDYIRENIFKPAGMVHTQADDIYTIIQNRAKGYRKTLAAEVQNAALHDTSNKVPGGGLVSTVDDLARFAIAVQKGALVKSETLEQMWTRPKARDGKEQSYALGWLTAERDGQQQVWNDGSQAGTRTYLFLLPKERFAVALMTNLERAWCEELTPKIVNIVLREQ